MNSKMQVLLATGVAVTAGIGYAIYFDRKRRSDPTFRKHLRREQRRIEKEKKEAAEDVKQFDPKLVLASLKDEELPVSPEQKEQYFMSQVAVGEQLVKEEKFAESVVPFYKALRVYPAPMELLEIYKKTVHSTVYGYIEQVLLEMKNPATEENPLD